MIVLAAALLIGQITAIQSGIEKEFPNATVDVKCVDVQRNVVCAFSARDNQDNEDRKAEVRLYRGANAIDKLQIRGGFHPAIIGLHNPLHAALPQVEVNWCCTNRNQPNGLYRIRGDRLEQIAEYTGSYRALDEDGDGIDELIDSGYLGPGGDCGPEISLHMLKYSNGQYRDAGEYTDIIQCFAGLKCEVTALTTYGKRIVLHIVNAGRKGHRVRKAIIRVEEEVVPAKLRESTRVLDVPVTVEEECPAFDADVHGPAGAELWIFVKEAK